MAEGEEEICSTSDLEETFERAAAHLEKLVPQLDSNQLLGFYGLYKQATCGVCDTSRPSWYQIQAKQKWEAWKNLGDMSKQEAMESYIRAVGKLDATWDENSKSYPWVAVSRLTNTDEELQDVDKTLLDWIKDGSEGKVDEMVSKDKAMVEKVDEDGMQPIHWAADRGNVSIVRCLVKAGADKNAKDNDGQTPLHYAASCGHEEAIKYFLSIGAELLEDGDGMTPKDVAPEELSFLF